MGEVAVSLYIIVDGDDHGDNGSRQAHAGGSSVGSRLGGCSTFTQTGGAASTSIGATAPLLRIRSACIADCRLFQALTMGLSVGSLRGSVGGASAVQMPDPCHEESEAGKTPSGAELLPALRLAVHFATGARRSYDATLTMHVHFPPCRGC